MKFANIIESNDFSDLYRHVQRDLLSKGDIIRPRGMKTYELTNVNLVLTNPRQRLLYSKVRKHNMTYAAGEFFWYMRGSDQLEPIAFYLKRMADFSDDGKTLNSGYGHRIFGLHKDFPNQWKNVMNKLCEDRDTRQAVITVHYQHDIAEPSKDVPCTLNLHFLIRDNQLNLFVQMRSNDAYMGLIYDVFSFTLMQELMFEQLKLRKQFENLELGTYVHKADSLHLYDRDADGARAVVEEPYESYMDIELTSKDLYLDRWQCEFLQTDEILLREHGYPIKAENYTGICKYMAVKLNKILEKK